MPMREAAHRLRPLLKEGTLRTRHGKRSSSKACYPRLRAVVNGGSVIQGAVRTRYKRQERIIRTPGHATNARINRPHNIELQ